MPDRLGSMGIVIAVFAIHVNGTFFGLLLQLKIV